MSKKCVLCKNPINGWGNNAEPFAKGTCCDFCNESKIIPMRTDRIRDKHIDEDFKDAERSKRWGKWILGALAVSVIIGFIFAGFYYRQTQP